MNTTEPKEEVKCGCGHSQDAHTFFTQSVCDCCSCQDFDGKRVLPSLVEENERLNSQLAEARAEVEKMRRALSRIDLFYRESSKLPIHVQAHCMRFEASAGLGRHSAEMLNEQLADFQKQYPGARINLLEASDKGEGK